MKSKLLFMLLLVSLHSFSQRRQSYFVSEAMDTIYCVLKVKPSNYDEVLFKSGESFENLPDKVYGYYDAILKNWYIANEYINGGKHFYREIVRGPVSLLSRPGYYYLTKTEQFVELISDKSLSLNVFASDLYKLKEFLKECSTLSDREIERIYGEDRTLNGHALTKAVQKYNQCMNPSFKTKSNYQSFPVEAVIFGSIGVIQPDFNDTAGPNSSFSSNYTLTDFNSSNVQQGQVKMRGGILRRRNVLFVTASYTYGTFRAKGGNKYTTGASSNFELDSEMVGVLSEFQFGLDYEFRINSRIKLFPSAGFGIFKTNVLKGQSTRTYTSTNSIYTEDLATEYLKNKTEPTWYFGGGLKYSIYKRWFLITEIILHTNPLVEFNNYQIKMNYKNWNLLKVGVGFKIS